MEFAKRPTQKGVNYLVDKYQLDKASTTISVTGRWMLRVPLTAVFNQSISAMTDQTLITKSTVPTRRLNR